VRDGVGVNGSWIHPVPLHGREEGGLRRVEDDVGYCTGRSGGGCVGVEGDRTEWSERSDVRWGDEEARYSGEGAAVEDACWERD